MALTLPHVALDREMERALERAAKMAVSWRSKRDDLIREAHSAGAGVREIGRAVNLTHPAIIRIVMRGLSNEPNRQDE